MHSSWLIGGLLASLCFLGCGGDDEQETDEPCDPVANEGCEDGQVCELVRDGEPACFAPLTVDGRVLDLADESGVEGAHVVALDINGAARSTVAISDGDGNYALRLPSERDADGNALDDPFTLHASAPGYATFPEPPRLSLPIELDEAVAGEGTLSIESSATTIGLLALDGDAGDGRIAGSIAHELGAGALVLAVIDGVAVSRTIADADGAFTLFNVPGGELSVEGYLAGLNVEPAAVSLDEGAVEEGVELQASTDGLSSVSGSVNIVNAEGGLTTSVILALEATFNDDVKRGIAPAGLRAADVSNAFTIEGVAPGRYVALAAFENDELVRDPDEGIAGTDIVHLTVDGEGEIALDQSFKVTQALAVSAPESSDELAVLDSAADPTFAWADDSSEDGYEVRIYDAFGRVVHEALDVARVTGGGDATYTWSNAALESGMIYQLRAWSFREDRAGGERSYISATEDLRGVFLAQAASDQESE